jgi:hypothetical protein
MAELNKIVWSVCLLCLSYVPLTATTYYVNSTSGNDSSKGTSSAAAWRTIQKVNSSVFAPGDHILLQRGAIWREALNLRSSGTAAAPIVIGAYGKGDMPIVTANDQLSGWEPFSSDVWRTTVVWAVHQVFRNGERVGEERSVAELTGRTGWYYDARSLMLYISCRSNPLTDRSEWEASRRNYAVNLENPSYVTLEGLDLRSNNSMGYGVLRIGAIRLVSGITIRNVHVSEGGSSCIIFKNDPGGSFDKITIESATVTGCGVLVSSTAGLLFGAGLGGPATNVTVTNCRFSYIGVHPSVPAKAAFGIDFGNVRHARLTNVEADHNGSSGIDFQKGSSDITVSGGSSHDNGLAAAGDRNGIAIGGYGAGSFDIIVRDMDIYGNRGANIEIASTATDAIMSEIVFVHNKVYDGLSHGVKVGGGHRSILFASNLIYDNAGHGFYASEGISGSPSVVLRGNMLRTNGAEGQSANLYIDSHSITLEANLICGAVGKDIILTSPHKIASDHNRWFHSVDKHFMVYHGGAVDLYYWKRRTNQDLHSIFANGCPAGSH